MGIAVKPNQPENSSKMEIPGVCRQKRQHTDIEEPYRRSKDSEIRWVRQRITELTVQPGDYVNLIGKSLLENDKDAMFTTVPWRSRLADLGVWLLKEGELKLSLSQIAYRFFACTDSASISRIRRALDRIEGEFGRGPLKHEPTLGFAILGGQIVLKPSAR
jgi:hypothetical protein